MVSPYYTYSRVSIHAIRYFQQRTIIDVLTYRSNIKTIIQYSIRDDAMMR